MARLLRWSALGLAFVIVGTASSSRLAGQGLPTLIILLSSPPQQVALPDDRGRLRSWRFEVDARVYDNGLANGGASLERGRDRYEFTFRSASHVLNGGRVEALTLSGRAVKRTGGKEDEFDFTMQAIPGLVCFLNDDGFICYDIIDGNGVPVSGIPPFGAAGTLTAAR